jgi:hypothetical protein
MGGNLGIMTHPYSPITNGDVYTEVVGMRAELRTALQEIAVIKSRNANADYLHTDHETRLRRIEVDVIRIRVVASAIASIAGIFSGFVTAVLTHAH